MDNNEENDGFSSSDGEFERTAEILILNRRIALLRKQIRRIRKEHSDEISEKDEQIKYLQGALANKEKESILMEELDRELKNAKEKCKFYEKEIEVLQNKLEISGEELQKTREQFVNTARELKIKTNELKEKEIENQRLIQLINDLQASSDQPRESLSQEQSQAMYGSLGNNSTSNFTSRHIVPAHLTARRHKYAKNFEFWNFDCGTIETQISKFSDGNFKEVYDLLAPMAQMRVSQIFSNGRFVDENGIRGSISTLILSSEKKLAIDFLSKPNFNGMTMRIRRMISAEIKQNQYGQNNHFYGPRK